MAFVAALSAHPLAAHAAGEVVGRVLEQHPDPFDVVVLLVSGAHVRQFEQIAGVVRATLAPRCLIGATAIGVLAGERELVEQPAIALWAGTAPGATAVHLHATTGTDGVTIAGLDAAVEGGIGTGASMLAVLAGPSFPLEPAVELIRRRHPQMTVVGGTVTASGRAADNKMLFGDEISSTGAVGLVLDSRTPTTPLASRAFRPIGVPLVVTDADGATIRELAGRPILDRLDEVLLGLDGTDAAAVSRSLHLGQVVDERQESFGPGDFTPRQVTAVDRTARSLSVAPPVAIGTTVQFLGRDANGADQDLRAQLAGRRAAGALAFVSGERGAQLFDEPDHDAELVSTIVDAQAVVGPVCSAVVTSFAHPVVDDGPTLAVVLVEPRDTTP